MATVTRQHEGAEGVVAGYAPDSERPPLGSYAALTAVFTAGFAGTIVAAHRSGRLPERVGMDDVVLIGTASHKLSRLVSKKKVTAFLRAPFTKYEGSGGPAELEERPRGRGPQRAIGELIACPYCLDLWSAAAFHAGLLWAPRVTRLIASTLTALTLSDFLQLAFRAAEEKSLGDG